MLDGDAEFEWILDYEKFKEAKDYSIELSCFCGSAGSLFECIDEGGINVNNSIGSTSGPFRTSTWIAFNEDPFKTALINGSLRANQSLFAGFDSIYFAINVSNNNPDNEPLEILLRTFLVNNETSKVFGVPNEGQLGTGVAGVGTGNSSAVAGHLLSQDAESGIYHITTILDVIYKSQFQVAQYIITTEDFNITSVQDTFQINSIKIRDFFKATVTLNETNQSLTAMPTSNFTDKHILLTEAFFFDFCINSNNSQTTDFNIFIESLILENPTLDESFTIIPKVEDSPTARISNGENNLEVCFRELLPFDLVTSSDYRLSFNIHVGNLIKNFDCSDVSDVCDVSGKTDFFYVANIEDMVQLIKWHTEPNETQQGNPGVFIVTEREEFVPVFDDVAYLRQQEILWDNSSIRCPDKETLGGTNYTCDYSRYPRAGEEIRICMEVFNFFSDEIFIELFNLYFDNDQGDIVEILEFLPKFFEDGVKSITDSDTYLSEQASRAD